MARIKIDPTIPLEAHLSYPKWSHRMANRIVTINGIECQECVKCGITKPLSEFYSYYYYSKTKHKKKKYKNSCKKCHIQVVLQRRYSDIKFIKLKNLYDSNYSKRKRNKTEEQNREPYLKYIW